MATATATGRPSWTTSSRQPLAGTTGSYHNHWATNFDYYLLRNPWQAPPTTTTTTGRAPWTTTSSATLGGTAPNKDDHWATILDYGLSGIPWQAPLPATTATATATGRPPWTTTSRATLGRQRWQQLQRLSDHLGLRPLGQLLTGTTGNNKGNNHRATTLDYDLSGNHPWQAFLATTTAARPPPWTTASRAIPWQAELAATTTTIAQQPWTTTSRANLGIHLWQQPQPLGDHLGLGPLGQPLAGTIGS